MPILATLSSLLGPTPSTGSPMFGPEAILLFVVGAIVALVLIYVLTGSRSR